MPSSTITSDLEVIQKTRPTFPLTLPNGLRPSPLLAGNLRSSESSLGISVGSLSPMMICTLPLARSSRKRPAGIPSFFKKFLLSKMKLFQNLEDTSSSLPLHHVGQREMVSLYTPDGPLSSASSNLSAIAAAG